MNTTCEAFYLPDGVLALLDRPTDGSRHATAMMIVPPFGWEEMCSYRGRRTWAQRLAHAGYPTARIDLPGTGDSAGSPREPGRFESWCAAVGTTAAWLRDGVGAERVVAIGIGLGGALICRAVSDGAAIDDLVLWSVPARGRPLLREMRAYAAMIASRYPEDEQNGPGAPDDAIMLVGYLMSADTSAAIGKIDLTALSIPDAEERRVLLLGRDRAAPDQKLREHFESSGASVTVAEGTGHDMLMAHPQETRPPLKVIETTLGWLGGEQEPSTLPVSAASPAATSELSLSFDGSELRETPLWFEHEGQRLFGILTEPAEGSSADVTVVLLNGGGLRRTGPNRSSVEMARRWAARGIPCVRVDYPGIGDSDGEDPELTENRFLYAPGRLQETIAVLDQLAARGLPDRFVLGGLCAAAYWGVHTALADPRVVGVLAINLWGFFWSPELVAERDRRATGQALRSGLIERVRSGRLNAQLVRRAVRSLRPRRGRHGSIERAQTPEVDRVLDQLRDQGTQVLLLLGEGEPLYEQFEREKRLERLDRWPNVTLDRISTRDHTFRALWLQRDVADSLDRAIERVLSAPTAGVAPGSG
jgi:pimeloyl-ACP methyl ester carboxylesterase